MQLNIISFWFDICNRCRSIYNISMTHTVHNISEYLWSVFTLQFSLYIYMEHVFFCFIFNFKESKYGNDCNDKKKCTSHINRYTLFHTFVVFDTPYFIHIWSVIFFLIEYNQIEMCVVFLSANLRATKIDRINGKQIKTSKPILLGNTFFVCVYTNKNKLQYTSLLHLECNHTSSEKKHMYNYPQCQYTIYTQRLNWIT